MSGGLLSEVEVPARQFDGLQQTLTSLLGYGRRPANRMGHEGTTHRKTHERRPVMLFAPFLLLDFSPHCCHNALALPSLKISLETKRRQNQPFLRWPPCVDETCSEMSRTEAIFNLSFSMSAMSLCRSWRSSFSFTRRRRRAFDAVDSDRCAVLAGTFDDASSRSILVSPQSFAARGAVLLPLLPAHTK